MGVYGGIAERAYQLAKGGRTPQDAWGDALCERYTDPEQLKNAKKHTCPKGAFLGLCQQGLLPGIAVGKYTRSVTSSGYAFEAVKLLRKEPSLRAERSKLVARVYGTRTPNDEVEVVLAFWDRGIIR